MAPVLTLSLNNMDEASHQKILHILNRLSKQVNELAKGQSTIIARLRRTSPSPPRLSLHIPSPSLVESVIVESPFVFSKATEVPSLSVSPHEVSMPLLIEPPTPRI